MRHSPARALRTIDLLRPHLDGVTHALDLHPGDAALRGVLGLPADVAHVPVTSGLELPRDERCLLVGRLTRETAPDEAVAELGDAEVGARALLLLRPPLETAPILPLGQALAAAGWRVLGFAELIYDTASCGVVAARVSESVELAETNQRVLERELVPLLLDRLEVDAGEADDAGHLRDRMAHLERQLERLRDDASEHRERERTLQRDLRRAERRLAQVEASTSFRLGHALVRAARSPSAAKQLPRELTRAVRSTEGSTPPAPEEHAGGDADEDRELSAERWRLVDGLTASFAADLAPSVALVGSRRVAEVLGRAAAVTTLLPHDGALLLDRLRPAVLLVQASAVLRGTVWAGGGTTVAVERDRDLTDLLQDASRRGIPTAWWWDAPAAALPLLRAVAATCDLTVSADGRLGPRWTAGADLGRVDVTAPRGEAIVHLHGDGRRAPTGMLRDALRVASERGRTRVVVDILDRADLTSIGDETGAELAVTDPDDPFDAYRAAAVVLATPFTPGPDGSDATGAPLAALLAGARVLSGPNPGLRDLVGDLVTFVASATELPAALDELLQAPPDDDLTRWMALRRIARVAAPFAALRQLAGHLGESLDPSPQRGVTVVSTFDDDPTPVIATILGQSSRPQVVVARGADAGRHHRALAELEASGIQVIATAGRTLPVTALTPWVVRLDEHAQLPPSHLEDLLLAAELGPPPDVVGVAGRLGPVDTLPVGGTLIRAELTRLLDPGEPDACTPRGVRSFAIPAAGGTVTRDGVGR